MSQVRILLVEDNPGDARLIQIMLEQAVAPNLAGFEWKYAESLETALTLLERESVEAALLDLSLPDSYGLNTIQRFCQAAHDLPVVVLTGLSNEELAFSALQAGAQDYLVKGQFDSALLSRTLFYSIERKRALVDLRQKEAMLERRNQELSLLNHASQVFNSTLELDQVLLRVLEMLVPQLGAASTFWLVDPESGELICRQAQGPQSEKVIGWRLPPGTGLIGWVAEHSQILRTVDAQSEPHYYRGIEDKTGVIARSVLTVPLNSKAKVIGVLQLLDTEANAFDPGELEMVEALSSIAAVAVENARLYDESQHYARSAALLNDITQTAISAPNLATMAQRLADRLGELFCADGAYITFWDVHEQRPIPAAAFGEFRTSYPKLRIEPQEITLTGSVLEAECVLAVEDVHNTPYMSPRIARLFPTRSLLGLPLIADGIKLGAALVGFNQSRCFTPTDIALGEQAASQIALALQKARLYNEVEELAITDDLTGLYNRRGFNLFSEQMMKQALRSGDNLLLVFIDVDGLKQINDSQGHQAGDQALKGLADYLKRTFRSSDIVARIGGDEFAVLAQIKADCQEIQPVQRIKSSSLNNIQPDGYAKIPSISIGFSRWQSSSACTLKDLLSKADSMMYAEKNAKKISSGKV